MVRTDVPSHDSAYVMVKNSEGRPTGDVACTFCGAQARAIEDVQHGQQCRLFRSDWDGLDFWESDDVRRAAREHAVRPVPDHDAVDWGDLEPQPVQSALDDWA